MISKPRYDGTLMELVTDDGHPVSFGDELKTTDGVYVILVNADAPHKPDSSGRIYVNDDRHVELGYYPSVCGLEWRRAQTVIKMNGQPSRHNGETIFVALPEPLWTSCGGCSCDECAKYGASASWDTLAVSAKSNYAWVVHYPEFSQPRGSRRKR